MSTLTTNLSLTKPSKSETGWWSSLNSDLDTIDSYFSTATYTSGSVMYVNSSGQFAQDNANFFWDATNKALAIGASSVTASFKLDVRGDVQVRGPIARLVHYDTSGSVDNKRWDIYAFASALTFQTVNDALSTAQTWLQVARSGTTIASLTFPQGGIIVGSTSSQGTGTIAVQTNVYKGATAYNNPDYVFEKWATGKIEKYKNNPGAQSYDCLWKLEEVEEFVKKKFYLPRIKREEMTGIFDMADYALLHIEELFIYLFDINKRLKALENK